MTWGMPYVAGFPAHRGVGTPKCVTYRKHTISEILCFVGRTRDCAHHTTTDGADYFLDDIHTINVNMKCVALACRLPPVFFPFP